MSPFLPPVLNALERLAGGYASEWIRVRQNLGIAESQLRDYQARLGKPFLHDAYLAELINLCDQLKAGRSGAKPEPGSEAGPAVSELAERIKAPHSIEAAPQRVRQKHSSAEEPVTARIRRRTERNPASDSVTASDAAPEAEGILAPGSTLNSSPDPGGTFQERIILERQRTDDGLSPP
jgi:hypothetical protein